MFPHVGRHIGWEDAGPLKQDRERYLPYALDIVRNGVCLSYANVDSELCNGEDNRLTREGWLWRWQGNPAGPGHRGVDRYAGALSKTCFVPPAAWHVPPMRPVG